MTDSRLESVKLLEMTLSDLNGSETYPYYSIDGALSCKHQIQVPFVSNIESDIL